MLGCETVVRLREESYKGRLILPMRVDHDWICAAFNPALRCWFQAMPCGLQLAGDPVDLDGVNDVEVPSPGTELQHIARYSGHCPSHHGRGRERVGAEAEVFSFDPDRRAEGHEETFVCAVLLGTIFEREELQPASSVGSRRKVHALYDDASALLAIECVGAD